MMPIQAMRLRAAGGAPPAPMGAYDSDNKSAKITLSEDNARMTLGSSPSAWNLAGCISTRGSGKRQATLVLASGHYGCIGVVPASGVLTSEFSTPDAGGVFADGQCAVWTSARLYRGGGVFSNKNLITNTNGHALDFLFDFSTGQVWLARNGTPFEGNPVAGTGESFIITSPGAMLLLGGAYEDGASNYILTKSSEFPYPVSGFIGWDD